jgi:hypothetical protein
MAFTLLTKAPAPTELAITNPTDELKIHMHSLNVQRQYWLKKEAEATKTANLGQHDLAHGLHGNMLSVKIAHNTERSATPTRLEHIRLHGLGLLAMSLFFRRVIEPGAILEDGRALGYTTLALDMYLAEDGRPFDARAHTLRSDADALIGTKDTDDQWYQNGKLYVHKTPLDRTDKFVLFLQEHEVSMPTAGMVTLFPYVASKR